MTVGIVFLPLLILAVLAIGVLIYYICYKIRINRTLKGEESGAHVPMASMESVWKVVAVIAVFVMYSSLSTKITNLQNELMNTRNALSNKIWGVQYELDEMQRQAKKEASMISEVSYDFGEINTKEHTVEMNFRVVPKSYSEETELSLKFGGETIALTNDGRGTFSGNRVFSIFEEVYEEGMIFVTEGGVTKTEVWEEVPKRRLYYECLPMLGVMSSSLSYTKGKENVRIQGHFQVMSKEKNVAAFQNLTLYVKNGNAVIDEIVPEDGYVSLDRKYPVKDGDSVSFFVKGVDEYGYIHEMFVSGWNTDDMATEVEVHGYDTYGYQVYAPDGTALVK